MEKEKRWITGKVTDEQGEPLLGVNVLIKGTQRGTATDPKGIYKLNVELGEQLVFSFVGREKKETPPLEKDTQGYNVVLKEVVEELPAVVVKPKNKATENKSNTNKTRITDINFHPNNTVKTYSSNNQNLKNAKLLLFAGGILLLGLLVYVLDSSQTKKSVKKATV